ncbi:MAG: PhzF family phenazine biosynthesis protein [Bacteroidota bacterium]|nr:MAG: PhzF family phenazine biosynthesis protein [Bacteroidota bacterium]
MKKIKIYQIDAFTDRLFSGNPAAVCILDNWLEDDVMQSIGNENNLAETAFVVPKEKDFEIRWFTPTTEVDLCGHATLAAAFVLFEILHYPPSVVRFHSVKSGLLTVSKKDGMLFLDFPTDKLDIVNNDFKTTIENCIGIKPIELFKGKTDYIAIIESEKLLKNLQVNLSEISKLNARGLIVTAKGDTVDFVSRFFAPQSGINEDPVTGSAHTSLIPIWSEKLGRKQLTAKQLSKRGGQLFCEYQNERCLIGGQVKLFLTGEIYLD